LHDYEIATSSLPRNEKKEKQRLQKHNPSLTTKSASTGSATTPKVQALTLKEAGAAESFLWLLSFDGQKKVTLSVAIPKTSNQHANLNPLNQPPTNIGTIIDLLLKQIIVYCV
jgi:hypothetical protein